jgi:GNAT superfamily N-acetyltransferase
MARAECSVEEVLGERDLDDVRALLEEYRAWLGGLVCSRRLDDEISSLPGPYAPPRGRILLARDRSGRAVGVVGLRPHHADAAEMKRLFVRPEARGAGVGQALAEAAVTAARAIGYRRVLLTTLPDVMAGAVRMYEAMGFRPTGPFADHSHVDSGVQMAYLELRLDLIDGRTAPVRRTP